MNFIINKFKHRKEASQLKEIIKLLLDVEMKRESPEPLDTYSFPDWRWLQADDPKEQWIEWATVGMVGKYHLKMVHQVSGTLVIIELHDEAVMSYVSDEMQREIFGLGVQDLTYVASEIPSILEELKATLSTH
ncbi:hypothetical protein QTV49_000496 [Vibrio vulnificus]|nr:hypothetical protein [Vibrio vulnificus]